jgi:hypothetical protein
MIFGFSACYAYFVGPTHVGLYKLTLNILFYFFMISLFRLGADHMNSFLLFYCIPLLYLQFSPKRKLIIPQIRIKIQKK